MYGPYTEFVVGSDEIFPDDLPTHIKVIDNESRLIPVNLDGMLLSKTGDIESVFRLRNVEGFLTPATATVCYAVILHALNGNRKVSTVIQWFFRFERMLKRLNLTKKVATVTLKMYMQDARQSSPNDLKTLRSFLRYWIRLSYPCIAPDLKAHILTSRSPKSATSIEIQARKAHERPFTIEKVRAIHRQVDELYIDGIFNPQQNLLWRLMISEALRPSQMQLLRIKDVSMSTKTLAVPLVKLHGKPSRAKMMEVMVSESVYVALRDHLAWTQTLCAGDLSPDQPIFCINNHNQKPVLQKRSLGITSLIARSRGRITDHIADLSNLDLFTRRFKHTKLTHLAILGAPIEVLKQAAFHTSSGSLVRYVNLTDEMADAFERQMDPHFTLVIDAFRGSVLDTDGEKSVPEDKLILDIDLNDSVGGCGAEPCGVLAPIGCYICPRFKAFLDGPHQQVLARMENAREKKIQMRLPAETIQRDDNIISAVKQVIWLCERKKSTQCKG
ncbi:tyrosine-type recombinase/integrase [Variovorax sp. GB1R11]|uniref:tyrosine-type recombinase/integrase n=1 Tax=Variovorax sp. GB1R11 TaxID=3443741 RepID=UPI003F48B7B5